jgi:hypothetical protein
MQFGGKLTELGVSLFIIRLQALGILWEGLDQLINTDHIKELELQYVEAMACRFSTRSFVTDMCMRIEN